MDDKREETIDSVKEFAKFYKENVDIGLGDRKKEDLTEDDFDFQGWLIPHLSVKNILEKIGFTHDCEKKCWVISDDNPLLNSYPNILQDDGMGYGGNSGKLTSVDYIKNKNVLNLWF